MLTTSDLHKIKGIVSEETRRIVGEETRKIVREETRKIVREETRKVVVEETKKIIKEELKPIKEDISQIRKDMKIVIFFDKEYLELRKRIERIEEHLNLSSTS